jgi:FkbM family methyltransferase
MRLADVCYVGLDRAVQLAVHDEHDKHISEHLVAHGVWEPFETDLILGALRPGDVFVDCGANIGWYTVLAAVAGAEVFAFEPMPVNAQLLRDNCARNAVADQVTIVQCALGDHRGTTALHLSNDNQGDHRVALPGGARATIDVAVRTLADTIGSVRPRVMKLDTQGSEVNILRGGRTAWAPIAGVASPYLVLEFWPYGLARCGSSVDELLAMLGELIGVTHQCFEIQEWDRSLTPRSIGELATMAHHGGYSEAMKGFTNLWLVPFEHASPIECSALAR